MDKAVITASTTFLCYPDTEVTVLNSSKLNCRPQGNNLQRQEYWNYGNYWGKGRDSLNGWIPFANPSSVAYPLAFPGKGTYNITMYDSNICGIDSANINIVVGDSPVAAFSPDKDTICAGNWIRFLNKSTGGINRNKWNFGDGVWRNRGSGTQYRTFNTPGSYTIYLAVFNAGGTGSCTDTISKSIYVLAGPTADFSITPSLGCDSVEVVIIENAGNAAKWNWSFGDGTFDTLPSPPNHKYNSIGRYTINLKITNSDGCKDDINKLVVVHGSPVVDFTVKNICENALASFKDNSTFPWGDPLKSWFWDFGDGISSSLKNPTHRYDSSRIFKLKLTVKTAFCESLDSFNLEVKPKPTALFQMNDSVGCSPIPITFKNNSIVSTKYFWDFGNGDTSIATAPTYAFLNSTAATVGYNVTLIASTAFGCSDTIADSVYVYHVPKSSFTSNALPNCGPFDVTFTNTSKGGVSLLWVFGDGDTSTQNNPTHKYQNKTLFIENYKAELVITSPNGCADTSQQTIIVYPEPIFTFQTLPDSGCSPLKVNFPALIGAVDYRWYFGDGDSAKGPTHSHIYNNSTINNVNLAPKLIATSSFGCSDTNVGNVLVFPSPISSFTVSDSIKCQPHDLNITNSSTGAIKYHWDFGNGDTSDTSASLYPYIYIHDSSTTINFKLQLVVETQNGCFDKSFKIISTYPQIHAAYSMNDSLGCAPLGLTFTNNSTGMQYNAWQFGDGSSSILASPSHAYLNTRLMDTLFYPKLLVASQFGCRDSIFDTVLVYPAPKSKFSKNKSSGCHPLQVSFINSSTIADTNIWNFGDGNFSGSNNSNINHTYLNTGSNSILRTVELIVETKHGCRDTTTQTVDVYPEINSKFDMSDTAGCADLTLKFKNTSVGENQYLWNFGDGKTDRIGDPIHTFINTDTLDKVFDVKLTVNSIYGCSDSIVEKVTVFPQPLAKFVPTPFNQEFPNATVSLANTGNLGPWGYLWSFGDTLSSNVRNPPSHVYSTWGEYNIVLYAFSAKCRDTAIQKITIEPPSLVVSFNAKGEGCRPLIVDIVNNTIYGKDYIWNFGDGGISRLKDPPPYSYFKSGTYTISLTVTGHDNGIVNMFKLDSVVVHENAVALFEYRPKKVSVPSQPVLFYNLSQSSTQWIWDFGNGDTSNEIKPQYFYQKAGTYSIRLISNNDYGCADTFELENAVEALSVGSLKFPTAFTPDANGPNGGIYDPNTIENNIFFPISEGVVEFEMFLFNRWGEMVFTTKNINQGWDGYYRETSNMSPQDVYVWKVIGKYVTGQFFEEAGEVTLIK